jgi:hypothetical protein
MTHTQKNSDNNIVLILSQKVVQDIVDYLCLVEDEGPSHAGWKSSNLMGCIGILEQALEEGHVCHT